METRRLWRCMQHEEEFISWGNGSLGGDVTLTGASCQLDRATILCLGKDMLIHILIEWQPQWAGTIIVEGYAWFVAL
uniref:Uncharacterized protein n=1 Tax=Romanomermis culicivorax TaxID=13658 RepID=A0A915I8C2_ROMCU